MDRELWSMIDYAVSKFAEHLGMCWMFPKESKFIERVKRGVTLYEKPNNNNQFQYKQINYNRRIASKRVFTHTKK